MKKKAVGLTLRTLRDIPMKAGLHCMRIKWTCFSEGYISGE